MEKRQTRKRLKKTTTRKSHSSSEEFIESSRTKQEAKKKRRLTSSLLDRKEVNDFLSNACHQKPYDRLCHSYHPLGIPIPESIGIKKSLELLHLNGIVGRIPDSICSLTNLIDLELRQGSIEGEIPTNIGNLQQLEKISFSKNQNSGNNHESLF